mgnify:CR=1 FL=1
MGLNPLMFKLFMDVVYPTQMHILGGLMLYVGASNCAETIQALGSMAELRKLLKKVSKFTDMHCPIKQHRPWLATLCINMYLPVCLQHQAVNAKHMNTACATEGTYVPNNNRNADTVCPDVCCDCRLRATSPGLCGVMPLTSAGRRVSHTTSTPAQTLAARALQWERVQQGRQACRCSAHLATTSAGAAASQQQQQQQQHLLQRQQVQQARQAAAACHCKVELMEPKRLRTDHSCWVRLSVSSCWKVSCMPYIYEVLLQLKAAVALVSTTDLRHVLAAGTGSTSCGARGLGRWGGVGWGSSAHMDTFSLCAADRQDW